MVKHLFTFCFALLIFNVGAQDAIGNESIRNKQRVNYIYNFTDYITWPDQNETDFVTVGVFGEDKQSLVKEFEASTAIKKIKGKHVKIKHFKTLGEITKTHILYVHKGNGVELSQILPKMSLNNTLLVSENYPFRASMINFIEFNNEFHFDVSTENINRAKLLVSPKLLAFSIQQQTDWEDLFERLEEEQKRIAQQTDRLEKLNEEIERQEAEMDEQLAQIKAQTDKINLQEGDIEDQQKELEAKRKVLSEQGAALSKLLADIKKEENEKKKIMEQSQEQDDAFLLKKLELIEINRKVATQEKKILERDSSILQQDAKINKQVDRLQSQGYLIYAFVGLFLLIAILGFFMYRQYRKKKASEREVIKQNVKLVSLNESLDSFVYRVSHDLKSPVINIKNMISMLKEYQSDDQDSMVPRIIENLDMSSERLELTITDLLELSRIERVNEKKENISISAVLDTLLPEYEDKIKEIGATIHTNFKGKNVYCSQVEMVSVLQNLITNSIKYRSEKRPLELNISTHSDGKKTILEFADNGQGIDLKQFEGKLFKMFQRFTSDSAISGTGVGMYIIKRLIDNNSGSIEIDSSPDNGLRYLITLPSYNGK